MTQPHCYCPLSSRPQDLTFQLQQAPLSPAISLNPWYHWASLLVLFSFCNYPVPPHLFPFPSGYLPHPGVLSIFVSLPQGAPSLKSRLWTRGPPLCFSSPVLPHFTFCAVLRWTLYLVIFQPQIHNLQEGRTCNIPLLTPHEHDPMNWPPLEFRFLS